jgi:hypothetical protein
MRSTLAIVATATYHVAAMPMKTTFVNLTPHTVKLNDGTEIPPSGTVARVTASYTPFDENGICQAVFGPVQGLPEPQPGIIYITSALVAQAAKRPDVVSPATGHPLAKRDSNGQVISVPGFVRSA